MIFIKFLSGLLPALVMAAAHYLPWRKALGRNLHRLEAYAIGTAGIIGTAVGSIEVARAEGMDPTPRDASQIIILAATGAGLATIASWVADDMIEKKHVAADGEEYRRRARHRTTPGKARGNRNTPRAGD